MKAAAVLLVIVAMALAFEVSEAIQCTPNICDTVKCAAEKCTSNQTLVKNGGFCGCCDLCVTILAEGEVCFESLGIPGQPICADGLECKGEGGNCSTLLFVGGGPPTVKCANGLKCVNGVCKKS